MTPIDLSALYATRYRIIYEESLPPGHKRDPWYAQIKCRYGHIYVYGDDQLGVSVNSGHVGIAGLIRRLPCCEVIQDGDFGEVNAIFHHDDLPQVLNVMKPYRRKQFSEETLRKYREHLASVNASRLSHDWNTPDPNLCPSQAQCDNFIE